MLGQQCCGELRLTKYCSACGKFLFNEGSLGGLLRHRQQTLKLQCLTLRRINRAISIEEDNGAVAPYLLRRRERVERLVKKWQSWVDQLESILTSE